MWLHRAAAIAVLSALALGSATGRSDDGSQGSQPPAGLLEFLGSVDRLSEVNPNYLSQPNPAKVARPPAASGVPNGAPKPPPAPPPAPTPAPSTSGPVPSGDKNNG
ncbi:MAG: hypothetical protein ACLPQ6_12240 [Steroidobacteraceae bacterium]